MLLGILANYNKFEHRNPYRLRMADFVNETTILQCQDGLGETCKELRNGYAMVQPDTPEPWNFSSALSSIGLGILAPIKAMAPAASEDLAKKQFSYLFVDLLLTIYLLTGLGQGLQLPRFSAFMILLVQISCSANYFYSHPMRAKAKSHRSMPFYL